MLIITLIMNSDEVNKMLAVIIGAYICVVLYTMYFVFVILPKYIVKIVKSIHKWIVDEIHWRKFINSAPIPKEFRNYDADFDERYYSEQ